MTPEQRYAALCDEYTRVPGVTHLPDEPERRGSFGATALKFGGRIFAMLSRGALVVKLPRARVDALVAAGEGVRFSPRPGRVMTQWLSLSPTSTLEWPALAAEALELARSGGRRRD